MCPRIAWNTAFCESVLYICHQNAELKVISTTFTIQSFILKATYRKALEVHVSLPVLRHRLRIC